MNNQRKGLYPVTTAPVITLAPPVPSVELVDPDTAQRWLGANTRNRNLKKHSVAALARDMTEGDWKFTGEAIKFAPDGTLLDGQHRLHAIIQAEVTVPMLIVRNVAPEAQNVMDSGAKRSASDALSLNGEKGSHALAAAAASVLTNGGVSNTKVTNSEILAVIDSDESIRWIVLEVLPPLKLGGLMSPTVAFYTYWRLNQVNADATHVFFDALSSLVGLPAGSPILALHRRLTRSSTERRGKSSFAYRQETTSLVFHAWNAWRRGEDRQKIQLTYGQFGRLMVPEPK